MDIKQFMKIDGEKPLDRLVTDGGFCSIFRTMGFVGDSLSSGEFESENEKGEKGYHDYFEYSWGQYIARESGLKAYNFSRGGMTAKEYCESFAAMNDYWSPEKRCQAYVIALGVNDITNTALYGEGLGDVSDIDLNDYRNNKKTFAGYYAQIIQRLKENQPKAKFFLMTIPDSKDADRQKAEDIHAELLYKMAEVFDYTYVLDFRKYAPVYDAEFRRNFFLAGHMNPSGYLLTAKMVISYIDYIVRNNPEDFAQVGFIGKDFHNYNAKW